jgi:pentose-5-phosphate-3-epimerase
VLTLSESMRWADLAHLTHPVKLVELRADVFHDDIMGARAVPPLAFGPVVVAAPRPHTDRIPHGHLQAPDTATGERGCRLAAGWGA